MTVREKLVAIEKELKDLFVERDDAIEGALLALLTRNHVLLIGLPGTAKSQLAHEICLRLGGARYFQWLLTRFTAPEEIFGPISLRALEEDRYQRDTTGHLPEAHIAFLDEVFKASSAILNALLTLMNERRFHNAGNAVAVPLLSLFGATNELPEEDELLALYDRFLLRFVVDIIQEDFRFLKMLTLAEPAHRTTLTLDELTEAQRQAAAVELPQEILGQLARLRRALSQKGIKPSDRRFRQSLALLRARAYLQGRDQVTEDDLTILAHVLWQDPNERAEVFEQIRALLSGEEEEARRLLFEARELKEYAESAWGTEDQAIRAAIESHAKLKKIAARVRALREATNAPRKESALDAILEEIEEITRKVTRQALKEDLQ